MVIKPGHVVVVDEVVQIVERRVFSIFLVFCSIFRSTSIVLWGRRKRLEESLKSTLREFHRCNQLLGPCARDEPKNKA